MPLGNWEGGENVDTGVRIQVLNVSTYCVPQYRRSDDRELPVYCCARKYTGFLYVMEKTAEAICYTKRLLF